MEDLYLIVLRLAHIVAGVFWVGAAYTFFGFVNPTLKVLGPDVGKNFMNHVVKRRKFPTIVVAASLVTVVAGALLYWRVSDGLDMTWVTSPLGLGFTLGALAAIVALVMGATMITPTLGRLERLTGEIGAAGAPPTQEQMSQLQALDQRLTRVGIADFALLTVALVFMAIARYLPGPA